MLLRTDYRKLNALFLLALILLLLGVWVAVDMDEGGRIVWTWFFMLSGFLLTSTGLLVRSK